MQGVEEATKQITIPEGKFDASREQNFHNVITREITLNGQPKRVELIHQVRAGDCILANFLNTVSIELDGRLPMTVNEARQAAIRLRQAQGQDISDIITPDSPLDYKDVVNLFSSIHGKTPKQEDVLTLEGRNKSYDQLRVDAVEVLEYLDTYDSGLCTTGLGYHSRTIKRMERDLDRYAIIDPMNPNGFQFMDTPQIMEFLATHIANQPKENNFFFFVMK